MHDVITRLKQEVPDLCRVYFRQDNAECYHCANTILAVESITEQTGITISGTDFSDPHEGKGACATGRHHHQKDKYAFTAMKVTMLKMLSK